MRVESSTTTSHYFFTLKPGTQKIQASLNPSEKTAQHGTKTDTVKLKIRDQKVHRHEQAHLAAAGGLATGGANFSYQTGPDGKQYAVGGEVNIDTSPVQGDPNATIRKAQQIRRAALAPADPSSQDHAVATSASIMEMKARRDLQEKSEEESSFQTTRKIDLFI
ncbi:MAG: putative metalloprotease CJM1_0395 family protein [Nitrospirales bacterium]